MLNKRERTLLPYKKVKDNDGRVWNLTGNPQFYPNGNVHIIEFTNQFAHQRKVRFDWNGNVIGYDVEFGKLILAQISS